MAETLKKRTRNQMKALESETMTRKSKRVSERYLKEKESENPAKRSKREQLPVIKSIEPKTKKIVLLPEKIYAWRWTTSACINREFLVKFKGFSVWRSDWFSEEEVQKLSPNLFFWFMKKNDLEGEPERFFDSKDDHNYERIERMAPDFEMFTDYLKEEFYQYGVHPEELIVHRVITHRENGKETEYLVKWRGLDYSQCTWEHSSANVPQLETSIDYYNQHRCYSLGQEIPKAKTHQQLYTPPPEPRTDLMVQLTAQPESVIETGLNLHGYQLDGLNWLRSQYAQNIPSILADEMGLGKTIQTATFLYSLFKEGHSKGPFLVVCPLSTMINWERELELWSPDFYTVGYVCTNTSKENILKYEFSFEGRAKKNQKTKFQVVVTSYEAIDRSHGTLSQIGWDAIVVDEAQRLKCMETNFFQRLKLISPNAFKLLLTGTPLQNTLNELFSLLNYMDPHKFDDKNAFAREFDEISKEDQIKKLQALLANHMLRRVKADVFKNKIPAKTELILLVELTAEQKRLYKCILEKKLEELNTEYSCFSYGKMTATATFMHLRKICNHPYLFPRPREEAASNKTGGFEQKAMIDVSGKFELLSKMLPKLKSRGHRVLMFSQMTKLLDLLEEFLENMNYKFERLDGNTNLIDRQQAIDRFNSTKSESFVFLLSTRAGGVGINLATADTVIVFDSDWNPHNDIQALSRAHRIGQRKKVMIYRLVCRQSVEERMIEVTKKKMMLTTLVVRKNTDEKFLTEKEIEEIVRFGTEKLFSSNAADAVVYDDAAIDHLLDRDSFEEDKDKENELPNEFLASFKVASLAGVEDNIIKLNDLNDNKV